MPQVRHSALDAESLETLNPTQHDEEGKSKTVLPGQPTPPPTIITNPPYGNRLQSDDLDGIYKKLIHEVSESG